MKLNESNKHLLSAAILLTNLLSATVSAEEIKHSQPWVVFEGKEDLRKGKHVVFVIGDDEYRSEEGMPMMARILAQRHGFKCTCLFSTNKNSGAIDTTARDNIPGLEALAHADLMVIFTRFRALPDEQMKWIIEYVDSGRPVIGLRTATHAFRYSDKDNPSAFRKFSYDNRTPGFEGGFGRKVLGETWVDHHGHHGKESTRGVFAPGTAEQPILRGIKDGEIWGPTDVYTVRKPFPADWTPLILGQVLTGMDPSDTPVPGVLDQNNKMTGKNYPMMPVAWTRTYTGSNGKPARVFTTTMGGAMAGKRDLDSEALRRLLVNATYWAVGLEDKIPAKANVDLVGKFEDFKQGVKASEVKQSVEVIIPEPGARVYEEMESRNADNKFCIYIPASYKPSIPMPLLVSASGNGPKDSAEWHRFADETGFIVLSPTFISCRGGKLDVFHTLLQSDQKMIVNVMNRVLEALAIDRKHVLFTGCSAGALPTWFVAAKHPELFSALCFRSGNFPGEIEDINDYMPKWKNRPIYIYWGEHDRPHVFTANVAALKYLQEKVKAKHLKHEIVPGGGHTSRADLATSWFKAIIQSTTLP